MTLALGEGVGLNGDKNHNPKNSKASNKINPKKSHADFRSLKKYFQKALNDITRNYHVTPCHFVVILIAHFVLAY